MKGQMVLEYPFNIMLYVVVILVVIGIIIAFKDQIITSFNLCQFTPQGCGSPQQCSTNQASEPTIDSAVLKKYCDLCWRTTGYVNYNKDCLCYVVSGSFSPVAFTNDNCELNCNKQANSLMFSYDRFLKKVYIKC
jgi:hypothetical protein